jgi:hypothetical protein
MVDPLELATAPEALDDSLREAVVTRTWGGLGFEQSSAKRSIRSSCV